MKRVLQGILGIVVLFSAVTSTAQEKATVLEERFALFNPAALRLALEDLTATFGEAYPQGEGWLELLPRYEAWSNAIRKAPGSAENSALWGANINDPAMRACVEEMLAFQREVLLANPLLDFEKVLLVKRKADNLALPMNWESNSTLPREGIDNTLVSLAYKQADAPLEVVYQPEGGRFVGDVELHFDGTRLLFSMPDEKRSWQIYEMSLAERKPQALPLIPDADVDNYDACYLPGGDIIFTSTAPFVGVPCVTGASHVSNLYRLERETGAIRRLTFEQDHDWCPTVLPNGRVMYLRWEYTDIPHFVSRILFHMNPDGTNQMEYYGSNSYWPNGLFFARPIPGKSGQFSAIVTGHHDVPRMGDLMTFDVAKGRAQAEGVVQQLPFRGKTVQPVILDELTKPNWPKFLHPYPLNEKYLLVSMKLNPESKWGLYLVDTFDNMLLLKELEGYALLEALPLRARPEPPVIPSRIRPEDPESTVYIADLYQGPGLKGIPRGTVKKLRVFTYHFSYHGMGGQINRVGWDGPWDIKRILGTVPVQPDGSAFFKIPANMPISVQPLDAEGKAVQLMRSWFTGMPGEVVSCTGCHESQNSTPPSVATLAATRTPDAIAPWYGPARGFSFKREVQPVLDTYCVECHSGKEGRPDFRAAPPVHPGAPSPSYANNTQFTPSYLALQRYVRTSSIESDIHLLTPGDFHADTSKLVRMLKTGHHDVELSAEAWDRIITWIDLNAPAHGTWHEIVGDEKVTHQRNRRRDLAQRFGGPDEDPEAIPDLPVLAEVAPPLKLPALAAPMASWVQGASESANAQPKAGEKRVLSLAPGIALTLVYIPAPASDQPGFWMGACEITNEQYAVISPEHDSRLAQGDFLQFGVEERGYPLNHPKQPVVRVSWEEAMAFCEQLSERIGEKLTLPTEAQWEYACRAGGDSSLWYGDLNTDFAAYENLADVNLSEIDNFQPWTLPYIAMVPFRPAIDSVDDGYRVSAPVGTYQANPWGLHDMHGNVAEWTVNTDADQAILRGGSWYDRPKEADATTRYAYPPWRKVFNVGFRIVVTAK